MPFTIDVVKNAFLWCFVFNMGLLLFWFLFLTLAHDWTYRMHSKWFNISVEKFDAMHYAGISLFKILIFAFNLVPYLALCVAV